MLITVELVSEQHGLDPVYGKVCLGIIITIGGPVQPDPLVVLVVFDGRAPMLVQGFSGVGPAGPVKVQVGGYTVAMREENPKLNNVYNCAEYVLTNAKVSVSQAGHHAVFRECAEATSSHLPPWSYRLPG